MLSAITGQIATLGHVSNFFATPAQVALAGRLTAMTGGADARVFFTNSGTEANEAAFKITRMTGRTKIIACEGAFHGRSLGALAITHNPKYRLPFEPLPGDVTFVPYGDAAALAAARRRRRWPRWCWSRSRARTASSSRRPAISSGLGRSATSTVPCCGLDEVQTGMGRAGCWLVHVDEGVTADVVTVAKGLGNGFPIGACIAIRPGGHTARSGQSRQHVRRQSGRGDRRTGGDRGDRARRSAGPGPRDGGAPRRRGGRPATIR